MGYLTKSKILRLFEDGTFEGKTFGAIAAYFAREGLHRHTVGDFIDELIGGGELKKDNGRFYLSDGKSVQRVDNNQYKTGVFRCN